MPHIPEEIIDEIAARADLVEIALGYVPTLKQAGSRWKGCCPFHQEKTPSFVINPGSNMFHCFGCGVGGNTFKFIMMIENLDFPNAVQMLARKYNVVIPEPDPRRSGSRTKEEHSDYNLRERLFLLHEKLAAWYIAHLRKNSDSKAGQYFKSRQLEPDFAAKFMIGAAPDRWDAMIEWARSEGFTLDELKAAHLVSESQNTPGKFFDFFRNRLIFPIWNEQGRVVGFSARQIDKEQGGGKYVNSMESPIFKKGRLLYGLNFARTEIPKKGSVILCEGQMDVIAMHTSGCTNAVAPQGTAFGQDQASILRRYTDTVLLATDSDSAGVNAVLKDAAILLPMDFQLKVVSFPGGKDPDELLHNAGPEAVRAAVEQAKDFFEFLYLQCTAKLDPATPSGKTKIAAVVIKYIQMLDNAVARDSYLSWLGDRLGIAPDALLEEFERARSKAVREQTVRQREYVSPEEKKKREEAPPLPVSLSDPFLKMTFSELLRVLLRDKSSTEKAACDLSPDLLDDGSLCVAVRTLVQAYMDQQWEQAPALISRALSAAETDCSAVSAILAEEPDHTVPQEYNDKITKDCLKAIRKTHLEKQIGELRRELAALPEGEDRKELLREFMNLSRTLTQLLNKR